MTVSQWLSSFQQACETGDASTATSLFHEDGQWRDYLPFSRSLKTVEGSNEIADFVTHHGAASQFSKIHFEGEADEQEGFFRFQCARGPGTGYIRLDGDRCATLFTSLDDLASFDHADESGNTDPFVLIVGGGQSGLALAARLSKMGVPYLVVDKYERVGGQWRSRYETLVLHDPVWYDHLPYLPFPDEWPVFTPKDRMADWLESYAASLKLNIQTGTECVSACYDEDRQTWEVELRQGDKTVHASPAHLVMAVGVSGFPRVPKFEGHEEFAGRQMHSSAFKGGESFAGQNVVVVGANNSAHDIAMSLVENGAKPVMIQRSSTLVVRQSVYCKDLLGPLYSKEAVAAGITAEKADLLQSSLPIRSLEKAHRKLWASIAERDADFYAALTNAGFAIDFAEDGAGLGLKYRRTASGYYIDVGASKLVADGAIAIRSGHGVSALTEDAVILGSGERIAADAVIYATGYGSMTDWVAKLVDQETANKVGPCWGYGSGTKGDPGPWVGELRNMWVETAQEGLWFMGGNLAQSRHYSHYLGLQLAGRYRDRV